MKRFKKILAMVIAMAMVLGMTSMAAFAATGELTPDTTMTVGGLNEGDQVSFYKLIKWIPGTGWAWADGVETAAATSPAITLPTLATITGSGSTAGVISAADGGTLAQVAQRLTAADTEIVNTGEATVTYTFTPTDPSDADATAAEQIDYLGLYVALVKPATANYLYNPIYVAADYNPDNTNTNSITVEEGALSYDPAALAKKKEVTLTKTSGSTSDVQYDVALGDTIPFTIESIVPAFSSSYQNPVYQISDTMDTGLELLTSPAIVVQVKDTTAESWTTLTNGTEYDLVAADPTTSGFTVALKETYLKNNAAPKDIKVTYSAKVTAIDDTNVVQKENTATVKFSNNPGDSSDYSLLEDKTNHYTFSLDANLLGNDEWENSELVKIGLNPDGTEITETSLDNGTTAGVLQGAVFGLYTDSTCETLYTNNNVSPSVTGEFTSDANGKLNISGLDAGTYYLKEISAPNGYIKSTDTWEIKITPTYATVNAGSYTNDDGILVNYAAYDYLTSYDVAVKNVTTNTTVTSSFTITNEGTNKKTATASGSDTDDDNKIEGTDQTTKLNNTRGTELPSTGGIGTTIFYVVGAILVIGAGVVMITRRRMDA